MTPPKHFRSELHSQIVSLLNRFETKRSSILPILHAIQDDHDWISDADIEALENEYSLPAVQVREVLTFYSMYRTQPSRPWRIEICNSISCYLMGSEETIKTIKDKLSQAEASGKPLPFEIHAVECLGVCGYAPVGLVNKDRHLSITPQKALELIEFYEKKDPPEAFLRGAKLAQSKGGAIQCQ